MCKNVAKKIDIKLQPPSYWDVSQMLQIKYKDLILNKNGHQVLSEKKKVTNNKYNTILTMPGVLMHIL